jgi:MFS family permease
MVATRGLAMHPNLKETSWIQRLPFYYGWVNLAIGVLAAIGTLPGRTWGLGLITESLLGEFELERTAYANLNLWATIFGATFCLPVGRLIDRFGSRAVLTVTALCLGLTVIAMSRIPDSRYLFVLVLLTRGFGQSALSIVSLALIGKWFSRRVSTAMTIWAVTMILGFLCAERAIGSAVEVFGWRTAWNAAGWVLVAGLAPIGLLLARSTPEACGLSVDGDSGSSTDAQSDTDDEATTDKNLGSVLLSPLFWVLALGLCINSLTQSGIGLFGVSLVKEAGLASDPLETFVQMMIVATFAALPGNMLTGWLARNFSLRFLIAAGNALLAVSLLTLPFLLGSWLGAMTFSLVWGLACGVLSVAMSSVWSEAFGRTHLGKIQGAVGVLHVVSSASGPQFMALSLNHFGTYGVFFVASALGAICGTLALLRVPCPPKVGLSRFGRAPNPQEPRIVPASKVEVEFEGSD